MEITGTSGGEETRPWLTSTGWASGTSTGARSRCSTGSAASLEIFSLFAAEEEGRVGEASAEMIEGLHVALSDAGAALGEGAEAGGGIGGADA